jgi:hypothetical protein
MNGALSLQSFRPSPELHLRAVALLDHLVEVHSCPFAQRGALPLLLLLGFYLLQSVSPLSLLTGYYFYLSLVKVAQPFQLSPR